MNPSGWSPASAPDTAGFSTIVSTAAPHRFTGVVERVAFAVAVAYVVFLAASYAIGAWLVDAHGDAFQTDFINVWAAGRLVLEGNPAGAYDWPIHKAVEEQGVGHPFDKYFGWHYPPPFLFVAAALSLVPYVPALLAWMLLTLPAYVAAIRMIIGDRLGLVLACAFPGVLWNFSVGQNGFLTAALIGGALLAMEKRHVLAGVLIGLISYKPQFGILFPLVLAVDRQWTVFSIAAITTMALAAASWLAFGREAWQEFFNWLPLTSELVLNGGLAGFEKLQTVFGAVRWLGGCTTLAWTLHGAVAAAGAVTVLLMWGRPLAYEVRAARPGVAVLLAAPYLYVYDLAALAVPMAFLVRIGLRHGFMAGEIEGLVAASILVLVVPVAGPTGLIAMFLVAGIIVRRAVSSR